MSEPVSRPWEESLYPQLRDDELAAGHLSEALNGKDIKAFLLALRHVVEARGVSMSELAQSTGLDRTGLYKMLSEKGNPELSSLAEILKSLGFQMMISKRVS